MPPVAELLGPLNETEERHAPKDLFTAGDVSLLAGAPRVAIVGSRKASDLGLRRAARLARELVTNQVTVVSGLAEGIDAAAHRAAMEAGGRTIAVLGTPLDDVFPPGSPTTKSNFPRRNRLMALISNASVIVEAGDSSGSLSQGYEALRLGRPLFLMRSLIEREDLTWPADMLGYGAEILDEVAQILEVLPSGLPMAERLAF